MCNFKINNLFKSLLCLIISIGTILLCLFTNGCNAEIFNVYFGVDERIYNLDPLLAKNYAEFLTARNCFRGLMTEDKDGNIICDLAKEYSVSEDGLLYTFKLTDAKWQDGTKVTADDFVFAAVRACDPITAAPYAHLLSNVFGRENCSVNGENRDFGFFAIDETTLCIRLINPDKNFIKCLTNATFMPCKREFFESCKGKYGLKRQYILTNGDYTVSSFSDMQLKLSLVDESKQYAPKNVYLSVSSNGKNNVKRILDHEIGMTIDNTNDYSKININKYNIIESYSRNYVLVFNRSTVFGKNEILASAFSHAVHREIYASKMSNRLKVAYNIIPPDSTLLDRSIKNVQLTNHDYEYNPKLAREEYLSTLEHFTDKKLPTLTVLTINNPEIKAILNDIVSQWQSTFGAYINISTVASDNELFEKVNSGNYTIALVPFSGRADDILDSFCDPDSGLYQSDVSLNAQMDIIRSTDDFLTAEAALKLAVELLSDRNTIIPIVSVPTAYIYKSDYKGVVFCSSDGTVKFSNIYK